VTGCGLDDQGLIPDKGMDFSLHYPALIGYLGGGCFLSLGVMWLEQEAGHLPESGAEVKNAWSSTAHVPYIFMAWCLSTRTTLILHFTLMMVCKLHMFAHLCVWFFDSNLDILYTSSAQLLWNSV
jgi:hypothetical protein